MTNPKNHECAIVVKEILPEDKGRTYLNRRLGVFAPIFLMDAALFSQRIVPNNPYHKWDLVVLSNDAFYVRLLGDDTNPNPQVQAVACHHYVNTSLNAASVSMSHFALVYMAEKTGLDEHILLAMALEDYGRKYLAESSQFREIGD